jgi:hypothetical protein
MNWKGFYEKLGNWELWPFSLRYLPITPAWLWYCLRARSFWFFTPSNPTITFGGFEGEGKKEMYDQLLPGSYPKTIYIDPGTSIESVFKSINANGYQYPFCVKPDVGMKGLLFRVIDKEQDLALYHKQVPVVYIIQELVQLPLEVSIFYYRYPGQAKGVISGFIQKDLMDVIGDGNKTLWELIIDHSHARHRQEEMKIKHERYLDHVIPAGERFILTYAANLNRGAKFTDLYDQLDDQLLSHFDALSHRTSFYYGRYDLKCESIEELKQGNFSILEFNGSGAEPNHVYHCNYSWGKALKVFLHHWKVLYEISSYNNKLGIDYWPFKKGWRFLRQAKRHLKVLEKYDREIIV